jgi:hypothetical protein
MFIDKGVNSTLVTPTGKVVNCRNGFGAERARSGQKPLLVKFDDLRLVNPFDFRP